MLISDGEGNTATLHTPIYPIIFRDHPSLLLSLLSTFLLYNSYALLPIVDEWYMVPMYVAQQPAFWLSTLCIPIVVIAVVSLFV